MVADPAVTGDGDGTMKVVAAAAVADVTEVETIIEMTMTMIGEIAEVLDVAEADGLVTTKLTMTKTSHHCRRPREMAGRTGRRPRPAPA